MYAMENNKAGGTPVLVPDWTKYMKIGTNLYRTGADILSAPYNAQTVDVIPKVPTSTFNSLSDVAPDAFWSPYH